MTDFLNSQFLGNTAQDWIIAAALVVIDLALTFLGRRESALGRMPWAEYAQVLLGFNELAYLD